MCCVYSSQCSAPRNQENERRWLNGDQMQRQNRSLLAGMWIFPPVQQWNRGKREEFKERREFVINLQDLVASSEN